MGSRHADEDGRKAGPNEGRPGKRQPVVGMVSLGCAKNTVDSERILGMLAERGFAIAADPRWADVVVVNTCAFISPARKETEKMLRQLAREKPVVAIGCYPERMRPAGAQGVYTVSKFRDVAAFVTFAEYDTIPEICARLAGTAIEPSGSAGCFERSPRMRTGSSASAYLKIAEGCDNRCAYCAVPDIRGALTSRSLEAIVAEARELAGLGARELCIVAQDTGIYGRDLYGEPRTAALMRELCRVDGIEWIRLLYVHPLHLGDDIIEVLATEPKMCRYLDLPVQHASSSVLARMGRGYDNDFVRALVEKLRRQVEGIALRTSIIVGFPGETDADFDELMRSVRELRFDHLGAFEYSPERGTPAAAFEDGLSAHLVAQRHKELMLAQQRIAFEILDGRVGATETALVEYGGPEMESDYVARTRRESPEVDGRVYVTASAGIELGSLVPVRILQRSEYDLIAEPLGS